MGAGQGLPPSVRLRKSADFVAALRRPEWRAQNAFFRVSARRNGCGHARLGIAVPKRVARRSVCRNRIKRLIRESFRRWQGELPAHDYVVGARSALAKGNREAVAEAAEDLWRRAAKESCVSLR